MPARQKIAVVGGGISGLASAYLLSDRFDVTVYESGPSFGGHARTALAGTEERQPVDMGFIVFNFVTYPHFTRMLQDLAVPYERSEMSFGVTIGNGRIEYGLQTLNSIFAQTSNTLRPGFLRMLRDIVRFGREADALVLCDQATIGDMMRTLKLGTWFREYYLLPICGAIWSTPVRQIDRFPARALIRFFQNHALFSTTRRHQWFTISGGSQQYVRRLTRVLRNRGVMLRPKTPVNSVSRQAGQIKLCAQGEPERSFDQAVFACHADQTLRLLNDPSRDESRALSKIHFRPNRAVLHRDTGQMPRRRACWSSWVYRSDGNPDGRSIGVTYWMNRLQNIPERNPLFVSINPQDDIPDELIYESVEFSHPVFDSAALEAQSEIRRMQGQKNCWFAGAWLRNGFHEDGFNSAVRISRQINRAAV